MNFVAMDRNVLYMSVRFIWSVVLFKSAVSLLTFCLAVLSIIASKVLKSPTVIILLSLPSVVSLFAFLCLDALMLVAYIF